MDIESLQTDALASINAGDLFAAGFRCISEQKYEEGLRLFDVYLSLFPWNPGAFNNKADCLQGLGRLDEAQEQILWALTLDPTLPQVWSTLAEIQVKLKQRFNARLNFHMALRVAKPEDPFRGNVQRFLAELDQIQ